MTASAIAELYETGAGAMIDRFVAGRGLTFDEYLTRLVLGVLPGDLLCLAGMEAHFGVRIALFENGRRSTRLRVDFAPTHCDTINLILEGESLFTGLAVQGVPQLEAASLTA